MTRCGECGTSASLLLHGLLCTLKIIEKSLMIGTSPWMICVGLPIQVMQICQGYFEKGLIVFLYTKSIAVD